METQKGKGLSGISIAMMAIFWFDIQINEIAFLGIKFQSIQECKFLIAWTVIWAFLLFRYLQRWKSLKDEYEAEFKKDTNKKIYLASNSMKFSYALKRRGFLDYTLPVIFAILGILSFLLKLYLDSR